MKKFFAWVKTLKWILWVVLAVAVAVVAWTLRSLFAGPKVPKTEGQNSYLPPVPAPIQVAVDQAHEDALVAKVESKVKTEEKKKELEVILATPDVRARRKRLAEFANSL